MNSSRHIHVAATAVLLGSMACTVVTLKAIDRLRVQQEAQQTVYIRSARALRRLSIGYTGLLADIYWTRAVQYFGYQHHKNSGDFHLLAPLLQVTTELDPRLIPPYQLGANFLAPKPPNGAGMPDEALKLLQFGIQHNPGQWRLYYELGFLYFTEFKDYGKAADAFKAGAQLPNTHEFMPVLAARMAQHAGEFDTARMLWYTTYQSTNQPDIQQNAIQHLAALRVDEDVTHLEEVVEKYRQQFGRVPSIMGDLERAGYIRGAPVDPNGKRYKLMSDGSIEVQDPDMIVYITKGLPKDLKTAPSKP
jgi:tetratricopeptide (TPR) repeat protein